MWSRIRRCLDRAFPVGTRSLLFGAHQFAVHPIMVLIAWVKLYGWPRHPAIYVAMVVHDWGYWGRSRLDDEEGEEHVLLGARIVSWLFDRPRVLVFRSERDGRRIEWRHRNHAWFNFCAFHSRFWARRHGANFSRLCVADKLATAIEPRWLYLPRVVLSGEIREFLAVAGDQPGSKYAGMPRTTDPAELAGLGPYRAWHVRMVNHMRKWALAHKDAAEDTWTPNPAVVGCRPADPAKVREPYGERGVA